MHSLVFDERIEYSDTSRGISLDISISVALGTEIAIDAKLDTGSTFCILERKYGEMLDLTIESGERQIFSTAQGTFTVFGHDVSLRFSDFAWVATVYFAEDPSFPVSVLGRIGFLDRIKLAIIDYDRVLFFSPYSTTSYSTT